MTDSLRSMDSLLEGLEKKLAEYIGTRHAVVCSSARKAIQFSLLALKVGHGDEVVIPDFACQIVPITVFCTGATPTFCDIDRQTLALSPARLPEALGPNTKAVIFVHLFGFPVDPSPITEITNERGIALVDDAAQALGATIGGRKVGSFGDVGIINFNKSLDVDLGGAATTNDEELAAKIRLIRSKLEARSFFASSGCCMMGRTGSRKLMRLVYLGVNYLHRLKNTTLSQKYFQNIDGLVRADPHVLELWRANALTAAMANQLMTYGGVFCHGRRLEEEEILLVERELENLEKYLRNSRKIVKMYDILLGEGGFSRTAVSTNSAPSYLMYPILFSDKHRLLECIEELFQVGIIVDGRYKPLHRSPFFGLLSNRSSFVESKYVSEHILPLPVAHARSTRLNLKTFKGWIDMDPGKVEKVSSIVNSHSSRLPERRL